MRRAFLLTLVFLTAACATTPAPTPAPVPVVAAAPQCKPGDALLNAALWQQGSAEYRANAMQAYATARRMLDLALADPAWTAEPQQTGAFSALPPAIILDLDETAIDNTPFEARAAKAGVTYDQKIWDQYISESAALETPGAGDFLRYARSKGVTPFYVTNRKTAEKPATRTNLQKLNYPLDASEDQLLFRGDRPEWQNDKSGRRAFVAQRYRVLMLFGDDLNDFMNAREKSWAERDQAIRDNAANWGLKWIILPNPMYGSWERSVFGGDKPKDPCDELRAREGALRP